MLMMPVIKFRNLALSIYERYKELFGLKAELGEDSYYGKEIIEIVEMVKEQYGENSSITLT